MNPVSRAQKKTIIDVLNAADLDPNTGVQSSYLRNVTQV